MSGPTPPLISIVTATYNRSRSLACTIEAIRQQTYTNWELIVVGDACTDDTFDVVAGFDDERIRFHNLADNVGEQAGPNNYGWSVAGGDVVAFCNHDVIWLPGHLTASYEALLTGQRDLVFGTTAIIGGDAPLPLQWADLRIALDGIPSAGTWDPGLLNASTVSASAMVMRRALLERLNGWRLGRECASEPSQDLLYRAWRAGARIGAIGMVTGVTAPSGMRPGSYVGNVAAESEWLLGQIGRPDFAAELLAAATETNDSYDSRHERRPRRTVRVFARTVALLGIDPRAMWFRYGRKYRPGAYIDQLREIRGLGRATPLLGEAARLRYAEVARSCDVEVGERVLFAAGASGARCLARGWSRPDLEGVWADGSHAELLLRPAEPLDGPHELELQFRVFGRTPRSARIAIGPREPELSELTADAGWMSTRFEVSPADVVDGRLSICFEFLNPQSPRELGLSDDDRALSVGLIAMQLTR